MKDKLQSFYKYFSMKKNYSIFILTCMLFFGSSSNAQPWTYDFGSGTGTANNANAGSGLTTFFSTTVSPATATPE